MPWLRAHANNVPGVPWVAAFKVFLGGWREGLHGAPVLQKVQPHPAPDSSRAGKPGQELRLALG